MKIKFLLLRFSSIGDIVLTTRHPMPETAVGGKRDPLCHQKAVFALARV
jgi:hypothetical protein